MKKQKTVAVVGLGYVGLPLAVLAKEKGWQVVGYDINPEKITAAKQHKMKASTSPEIVADADIIVIAVPTPVTPAKQPDLRPVISSVESILPHLKNNQTLILESTVNPGVMDEVVMPILKRRNKVALHVAYCPERINPGDKTWTVRNIPRVLGAYGKTAEKRALAFYQSILEAPVKLMQSVTEAEAVKILENSFRDVNIAFVNEMARSFDKLGIDVMNVIEGASTKPFAFLPHYPGNGVGGHCIGVDPYYMIERGHAVGFHHQFLQLARDINNSMPAFTVELLERGLKKLGLKKGDVIVALLGLSYKKDTADDRESPALEVRHLLKKAGFQLAVFDPFFPNTPEVARSDSSGVAERGSSVSSLEEALRKSDVIMLATNHTAFIKALTPAALKKYGIKLVIDGKNALNPKKVISSGALYYGVGRSA